MSVTPPDKSLPAAAPPPPAAVATVVTCRASNSLMPNPPRPPNRAAALSPASPACAAMVPIPATGSIGPLARSSLPGPSCPAKPPSAPVRTTMFPLLVNVPVQRMVMPLGSMRVAPAVMVRSVNCRLIGA
ncbi:MAG: hypothetical protein B6D36_14485 [Planctomycetes bacterium UTPLA1]|nr:MAG: hypothetical protein B6D36_14485 [Planctomycetes bacterium UTPLA1]